MVSGVYHSPMFGKSPLFGSKLKQDAAQSSLTESASLGVKYSSLSFESLAQHQRTNFICPAYIGLGQSRTISSTKPQNVPLRKKSSWR